MVVIGFFVRVIIVVVMMMVVRLGFRTGSIVSLSTAGFAIMTAAVLPLNHTDREIPRDEPQLARQRHRDMQIGEQGVLRFLAHNRSMCGGSRRGANAPLNHTQN